MTLIKIGKKGKAWEKARKRLKKEFEKKGITSCEICGSTYIISFHHRHKRRENDEHIFKNVILLCERHHRKFEDSRSLTELWFDILRSKEA